MTKKDYELIAGVLREYIHLEWYNLSRPATSIAEDLADVFASENERFDYKKFMEACTPNVGL
tara:strand:+ start:56 stop:241 length:186 start_codon:yes stop_codon:yes gene_type:complete